MLKLLKRTAHAERQASRRAKKIGKVNQRKELGKRRREEKEMVTAVTADIRAARIARREKWELGPLAPRRDLGNGAYGAMETLRSRREGGLTGPELERRCAWAGGFKNLNIKAKDRVVVLEGPCKGQIDRIAKVNLQTACVELENINKVAVKVPEHFQKAMNDAPAIQATASEIPISAIRLVHPLPDPKTGVVRDVIIRELASANITHRPGYPMKWTRIVPGLNISIPWPHKERIPREDKPGDTLRIEVEKRTFIPTLLRPPMPPSVLDELRNKYSKFRTRHEEEYIIRKEAEEQEKQEAKKLTESMRTPLQVYNKQQREKRKALGQPQLTGEMLEKIGQVMARRQATMSQSKQPQILDSVIPPTPNQSGNDAHPPSQ